jgi:hypothetical protein
MGWKLTSRFSRFKRRNDLVSIVQDTGWDPLPAWSVAENFDPTGIRSPDRPARSQSQYQLCYPSPTKTLSSTLNIHNKNNIIAGGK